jgi:hypothetical protein
MKKAWFAFPVFAVLPLIFSGCAGGPGTRFTELENKGSAMGIPAPDWVKTYVSKGISVLQAQGQFKDKYCVVGEETGVNKQFVLAWADSFSARQRIGAMLRTNLASGIQLRFRETPFPWVPWAGKLPPAPAQESSGQKPSGVFSTHWVPKTLVNTEF